MSPALKMGFELLRPWGIISSVGVHNAEVGINAEKTRQQSVLTCLRFPGI
jgi:hypothetical protein